MTLKRTLLAYVGAFAIALTSCGSESQAPLKNLDNDTESVDTNTDTGTTDTNTNTGNGGTTDTNTDNGNTDNTGGTDNGSSGNNGGNDNGSSGNNGNDSGSSGNDNASTPSDGTGSIDTTPGSCEPTPFNFSQVKGIGNAANQQIYTYAVSDNGSTQDLIFVESYQSAPYNGPAGPGTYELDGSNYKDCGLCVLLLKGCTMDASGQIEGCEKQFYAQEGTVQFNQLGSAGEQIDVELLDVNLVEVTIATDYTSTPVAGGESWCAHGYQWSSTITDASASGGGSTGSTDNTGTVGECSAPENGTGTDMGDQIGNITLTNCNGETVSLHDSCGQSRIIWLIGSATWCGYCPQQIAEAKQAQQQVGMENLALYMMVDDVYDASGCNTYAQAEGMDPAYVLYSPQQNGVYSAVTNRISGVYSGFPMNAIMNGSTMELLYKGDGYAEGLGNQVVESLNQ